MSPVLRAALTALLALIAPPAAFLMAGWGWGTAVLWCAVPLGIAAVRYGTAFGVPVLVHDPLLLFTFVVWVVMGVASTITAFQARRDAPVSWIAVTAAAVLYVVLGRVCVIVPTRYVERIAVRTAGMAPQLLPGDAVLSARPSVMGPVEIGDVVVLRLTPTSPDAPPEGYRWIRRVVAVGGQRVELHDGRLFVDGRAVERQETAARRLPRFSESCDLIEEKAYLERVGERWITVLPGRSRAGGERPPIIVPEGHVYVLGDHRDRSMDSRRVGPLPLSAIEGRLLGIASPITTRPCPRFSLRRLGSRP